MIDASMYAKIADSDWRKLFWKAPDTLALAGKTPWIDSSVATNFPDYASAKFRPNNGEVTDGATGAATAYPLMRVAEMYFIKAEAEAQQGSLADAKQTLTSFMQKYRNTQYSTTATTQADLINEIIFQKRVELWGEGLSYFDYKRLNMSVTRNYEGSNFASAAQLNTKGRPVWMNFVMPTTELSRNAAITRWGNPEQDADSLSQLTPADFTIEPLQLSYIPLDSIVTLKLHAIGCDQVLYTQAECAFNPDFADSFYAGTYTAADSTIAINSYDLNTPLRKYCDVYGKEGQRAEAKLYLRGVETVSEYGQVKSHSNTVSVDISSMSNYTNPTTFFGKSVVTPVTEVDFTESPDSVRLFTGTAPAQPKFAFEEFGSAYYVNPSTTGMGSKVGLCQDLGRLQLSNNGQSPQMPLKANIYYQAENHDVVYNQNVKYELTIRNYDKLANARAYFYPETGTWPSNKTQQLGVDSTFIIYIGEAFFSSNQLKPFHLSCDNPKVKVPEVVTPTIFDTRVNVDCSALAIGDTVQATISIDEADALLGGRRQMTFTIAKSPWVDAGSGTFTDNTFGQGSANVKVQQYVGSNKYRLVAPYAQLTNSSDAGNLEFTLNADSTVTIADGIYDLFSSTGYQVYYNATRYPSYCYVTNEDGLITVTALALKDNNLYTGVGFTFKWTSDYPYVSTSAKPAVMRMPAARKGELKFLRRLPPVAGLKKSEK